ncbi:MAG: LON peptidase substrate-binding domain-containing protein [Myxococcales bacterium]|nr:LON peptidase substrate-binding domain-containing protein [Myxococcales bacterium]
MNEVELELPAEALSAVPIFPLPGTVLLPGTFLSLHVFEPRYRAMMEYVIEGHRLMVVAQLDPLAPADAHGRPGIHPVAGLGLLRRSVRLPDGRYNIVLEGLGRVDVRHELPPTLVFRRAAAELLEDVPPADPGALDAALASLKALCQQVLIQAGDPDPDVIQELNEIDDPGRLADLAAAAGLTDPQVRQQVLAEAAVDARLELVAGALGAQLLSHMDEDEGFPGWGIGTGKA